jgi:DNA-binding MarR family transcriptional regulator
MSLSTRSPRPSAPQPGALEGLEASLVATIPPVMRHLLAHARKRPAWAELTYSQYNVLRIIDRDGPTAQAEIARGLMVSAPVVTRIASALADAGLVERRNDPRDRRTVRLALTPRGRRRVRAMRQELLDAAGELLAPLPDARRAALAKALQELQVLFPGRGTNSSGQREPGQRVAGPSTAGPRVASPRVSGAQA